MQRERTTSGARRALLIEPQKLFVPYFVATLEATGLEVVGVLPTARASILQQLRPDVVVVDAGHLTTPPLRLLQTLRRRLPGARVVVYVHAADSLWSALARSLGADAVIGPKADEADLIAAVGGLVAA